jgi:SanA protein
MRKKKIIIGFILFASSILLLAIYCNTAITRAATNKLYTDANTIPYNKVGLLLGTSKFLKNGQDNPYYIYRIQAATTLIKASKIKYIIISGDNSRTTYNEPAFMRTDLIAAGVDSSIIYLDYAGFRTFDSIKRLKEIFGQDSVTIISQQFHNERAIYIAEREGIAAIGFNARDIENQQDLKTPIREKFARVKVFLDYWFGTKPKYLGNKIKIP